MNSRKALYLTVLTIWVGVFLIALMKAPVFKTGGESAGMDKAVEGTVRDAQTDELLEDITLEIEQLDRETKTDESGYFRFEDLDPGVAYTLQARNQGYQEYEEILEPLNKSPEMQVNIKLEPKEDDPESF